MKNQLLALIFVLQLLFGASSQASLLKETTIPANFGINVHFLTKDLDKHVALLKEIGVGWVRRDLDWSSVEKEQGVYNFSLYDTMIDTLNAAGIKVLLILDYRNAFYDSNLSPYTNIGRKAFARFVEAAAQRYKNKDVAWEIYNEPNWGFWKPTPNVENYIALARSVTDTLRKAVPHQPILAPALAGPVPEHSKKEAAYSYLNSVLSDSVAKQWDAISIHPYRVPQNPETVLQEMPRTNASLSKHSIKAPIIFTEWGYHTSDKGVSEDVQAAYAARSMLLTASMHMPFSIWYSWQEAGNDSSDSEQQYGLIRFNSIGSDDARKPAFNAIRDLGIALNGYRFDKTISSSNGIFCMQFKKGRQLAYALWTTEKETKAYQLHLSPGQWQATTLLEESNSIDVINDQPATLQLQAMPLIVKRATE